MLDPFPGVCWSHQVLSRTASVMAGVFAWRIWVDTMFRVTWKELGWTPGTIGDSP